MTTLTEGTFQGWLVSAHDHDGNVEFCMTTGAFDEAVYEIAIRYGDAIADAVAIGGACNRDGVLQSGSVSVRWLWVSSDNGRTMPAWVCQGRKSEPDNQTHDDKNDDEPDCYDEFDYDFSYVPGTM